MTYQEIIKDLKAKQFKPLYFLHGAESFYIDKISDWIEANALNDAEKGFNQSILYGKEVDARQVIDTASRFPMMSQFQVVILKEAQDMRSFEGLATYVEKPVPTTIMVIAFKHKSFKKFNTKFGKTLKKNAVVFESKPIYDNKVPDWIMSHLKTKKLTIKPQVAALIGEYLGTDLSKISNELEKLSLNLPKGTEVTVELVEKHIGISKEYNVFEFQRALAAKDILKTNKIVKYFAANEKKHPLVMVTGTLYTFFSKVFMLQHLKRKKTPQSEILSTLGMRSDWFLRDYSLAANKYSLGQIERVLHLLKEYDLKSKGVEHNATGTEPGALVKEMAWKILH